MRKTKPTNKVLRTINQLETVQEEMSEDIEPEIIEDYGDTNTILYTNHIITNNWFEDADDYPPNLLEGSTWDESSTQSNKEDSTSTQFCTPTQTRYTRNHP